MFVIASLQEEYKKGVSSWNFDVAALKAQADLEGDDEPMLPTISESEEREDKEDMTLTGISAQHAAEFIHTAAGPTEAPTYISAFGEAFCEALLSTTKYSPHYRTLLNLLFIFPQPHCRVRRML